MHCIHYLMTRGHWALVLLTVVVAANARPDLKDYGDLPQTSMVRISPNGELLAYRSHTGGKDAVLVISLRDNKPVQGVDVSAIKLRQLYFFDDSKLILRASEHRATLTYRRGLEMGTAFVLDIDDGGLEQLLTPGDNIYKHQTGLGSIVGVSKDKEHVYMPAFVPESDTDRSPDYSLMEVDLASPRRPGVLRKGENYTEDFFVDDGNRVIAEELYHNRAGYHSIVSYIEDDEGTEIFHQETDYPKTIPVGVTPDYRSLVVRNQDRSLGRDILRTMSLTDGEPSEPVFARDDADVERTLRNINREVHGVVYSGLRPSYGFFDPALEKRMAAIVTEYPGHSVWLRSWTPDWKYLVVEVQGPQSSGDYMLYNSDGERRFLTRARPGIKPGEIHPISATVIPARDGLKIPTLLTLPSARQGNLENLPAVMLPHGGPESHDWLGFNWIAQALANEGYLVIQPQFRGSSGFGAEHTEAGRGEWGKKMQDDLTDAVDALSNEQLVDPERVCIMGISYGGYAALAGGAFTPDLYQCVVSINGVSDLEEMLNEEGNTYGDDHWVVAYWEDVMAEGQADNDVLHAVSPANAAEQFNAPVLLIHGEDDENVAFEQSDIMRDALEDADKKVELIELDDEDHYLSRSDTRMTTLKAAVEFINSHIGHSKAE